MPRGKAGGGGFWLLTDRGRDFLGVAFQEPGAAPRFLYAPPHDVEVLQLSPDESLLAVVVNEGGYSRLRFLDAASGAVRAAPWHPRGVITKVSWAPDGSHVAFDRRASPFPPGCTTPAGPGGERAAVPGRRPARAAAMGKHHLPHP
ncbi:TolB-like translocation protein [Teichococcus aestuarii]|uniref:hypothetical protein n=1 Tax=Teichococcus aestuarii TaxID=568898 RepID=UPI0036187949